MNTSSLIRRITAPLCVATLVLFSHNLSAGDSDARRGPKSDPCGGHALVVKGEFETAIQILPPFPSFPPGPFQPILHLLISATGMLSHFGKATAATTDQAVDLSVNPNKGSAHWVFQNTRGDALWTEMDLSGTPLDADGKTTFQGILTVIGGTGKFEGATGTLQFEGGAQGTAGFFSVEGTVCVTSDDDDQ